MPVIIYSANMFTIDQFINIVDANGVKETIPVPLKDIPQAIPAIAEERGINFVHINGADGFVKELVNQMKMHSEYSKNNITYEVN